MMKKLTTRRPGTILLAGALLIVLFGDVASAHGRRGGGRRTVIAPRVSPVFYGGFYGGIYGRPYLSPFWAGYPYFYEPYRSIGDRMNPALAQALDVGALDLDIKPRKAEVYVDGAYVGVARDLDGGPSFLWLDAGRHEITIHKGGYESYEGQVVIEPGVVGKVKLRLTEGASEAPTANAQPAVTGRSST